MAALVVLEVVVVALFIAEPWDRNGVGRIESIGWVRVEIAPDEQTAVVWSFPVSNECWEYHDTTVEPMGDEVVIDVTNRQVSPNGTPCTLACSVGVDPHEVPWDPEWTQRPLVMPQTQAPCGPNAELIGDPTVGDGLRVQGSEWLPGQTVDVRPDGADLDYVIRLREPDGSWWPLHTVRPDQDEWPIIRLPKGVDEPELLRPVSEEITLPTDLPPGNAQLCNAAAMHCEIFTVVG